MSDMGRLAQLAVNPQGTSREEIYLAVASLYRIQGTGLNQRERALMHEILRRLTRDVEMAIRIALAERLADDTTAPHDLILLLADDRIEVARPLLLRSPLLTDGDFLKLIAESGQAHHEAVASRDHIGEPVTDVLASSPAESVLVALVRNATAKISTMTFETLVEKSRNIESLHEPLTQRTDLPPVLATKMCEWVSDALKTYIARNYAIAPEKLSSAMNAAETLIKSEPAPPRTPPAESAQKLIDKLASSGQLKAGFLLRVLHQGQLDLFDLALAKLVGLPLVDLRKKFYDGGPRAVALACRGVGIDRCVFNTVFNLSRQARDMRSSLTHADMAEVDRVFATTARPAALAELAKL
ncbi:MAG TPA: DUF2336 domain-containing protein [Rhizomicrobium sp.]|jgi:uncharacterized protein (DUF2336 family)|nr:DUF2336 domain-containing protein [Rhizomicrobium sp.]